MYIYIYIHTYIHTYIRCRDDTQKSRSVRQCVVSLVKNKKETENAKEKKNEYKETTKKDMLSIPRPLNPKP